MSAFKNLTAIARREFGRLNRADEGATAVEFGLILPMLVLVCLALLEFTIIVFDYHRASEATRRGARVVAISEPILDPESLTTGGTVTCLGAGGGVTCNGGAADSPEVFNSVIAEMQDILPAIQAANVVVEYQDIGLGDITTPGGIIPLVTVRIVDLDHPFLMLQGFPGFGPSIPYPDFTTNQMAGGLGDAS
jgi:hypothetical protein